MPVLVISKKAFGINALAPSMLPGAVGASSRAIMVLNKGNIETAKLRLL